MSTAKPPTARRLQALLDLHSISQRKLGLLGGLDPAYANSKMNHYVKDRHSPPHWLLQNLAKEFEFPVSYFYEDNDEVAVMLLNYNS